MPDREFSATAPVTIGFGLDAGHGCTQVKIVGRRCHRGSGGPYDPYNQPSGVLDFYRRAKAAELNPTLWVRLVPGVVLDGQCDA